MPCVLTQLFPYSSPSLLALSVDDGVSQCVINLFHFTFVSLGELDWYESFGLGSDGVLLRCVAVEFVVCKYPTPRRWALDGGLL